jgi:5-methylthioribose kinase|tara:strand:- start:56 stop:328 length:273 start_codon:yes stop_codon:yes gene_type:complete
MMSRSSFNEVMRELWQMKSEDLSEAWQTYQEAVDTINRGDKMQMEVMEALPLLDKRRRLRWRENMAIQGIEMTPTQVDQYISILELAMEI